MTPTTTVTERTVSVGGKEIFLTEAGRGAPVVLLHGGGPGASGLSNFSRNVDALAEHFRVIVPDLPGYGRSSKGVDGSDPFGYLADAIRGLLDALGIDRASLVGNSYGGACALRLALDTPGRVDKLVLMGPGGIGTTRARVGRPRMSTSNSVPGAVCSTGRYAMPMDFFTCGVCVPLVTTPTFLSPM